MAARLKHVDPSRRPGPFRRAYAALANTRLGRFLSVHLVWRLDPHLMRLTRGRLGMGLVLPTALLETRGAKSGAPRSNVVIYFHDGERVTIVASKLGLPQNPAWFHNLRADPDVTFGGSRCGRPWSTTRPSAAGSGGWPTASSRPTPCIARKRRGLAGRSQSSSSPRAERDRRLARGPGIWIRSAA